MKRFFAPLAIGVILAFASNCFSQETEPKRVLFLGNSVFYFNGGVCSPFKGFCDEAGLDFQTVSQWKNPSSSLGVEFLNYGRIPLSLPEVAADKRIHSLIDFGNFDFVILEGRRVGYLLPESVEIPDHRGKHIPYAKNVEALGSLHRTIVRSGAQTVLYMHPGTHSPAEIKHPVAQIYQRFHSDLRNLKIDGTTHEVILVPAMMLWIDATRKYRIEGWYTDHAHGNPLARYSSACMLYTYLTGNDPRQNDYKKLTTSWNLIPAEKEIFASDDDATWIKDQVWLYYSTRPR